MFLRNNYSSPRRWARKWCNSSVELVTKSTRVKALGLNISEGGMGLFAVANLRVGSEIEVEFRPPASNEKARMSGTVRHRALYLYGIEFHRLAQSSATAAEPCADNRA